MCFFVNGVRKTCWGSTRSNALGACNRATYDTKLGGLCDWDYEPQMLIDEFKIFKRALRPNMNNFQVCMEWFILMYWAAGPHCYLTLFSSNRKPLTMAFPWPAIF